MAATVLVTGASTGIGRITAQVFVERGFQVAGTSRHPRPTDEGVRMVQLDVRSDESVRRCVTEVTEELGPIDVLVNNAGAMHLGMVEETTTDEAHAVFETNFFGAVRMVDAVLPSMRERGAGRIVNVGSAAAWVGEPGEGYYAASKAALARYTESLRFEVRGFGVTASIVEPGAFRTDVVQVASRSSAGIAAYDRTRAASQAVLERAATRGRDPRAAAELIVRVARAKHPRLRYGAGAEAVLLPYLRALMPQRLFESILCRAYRWST